MDKAAQMQAHAALTMVTELVMCLSDRNAIDLAHYAGSIERAGARFAKASADTPDTKAFVELLQDLAASIRRREKPAMH